VQTPCCWRGKHWTAPKVFDAIYASFQLGELSTALPPFARFWIDCDTLGVDERIVTGAPTIPLWRVQLYARYKREMEAGRAAAQKGT
jgi:hypothetical protein